MDFWLQAASSEDPKSSPGRRLKLVSRMAVLLARETRA